MQAPAMAGPAQCADAHHPAIGANSVPYGSESLTATARRPSVPRSQLSIVSLRGYIP